MIHRPYDITSPESLRDYAKPLIGKSLEEAVRKYNLDDGANKGKLGTLVEEYYYQYKPDNTSDHEPDFVEAGVELKVTGVVPKRGGGVAYKAKERLVLTMIHYVGLADEAWDTSSFLKKCRLMLILFYLYQKELPATQRRFVMNPVLWEFPEADLEIIRRDWEAIQRKVLDGRAHELSEGDTFYLAACRKGPGGLKERLKRQPFSDEMAKSRAFSLKPSYVNTIIDATWKESQLAHSEKEAEKGLEELTLEKFQGLYGLSDEEIARRYDYPITGKKAKGYYAGLSLQILGTRKKHLPEFVKADVNLKTIRLTENGALEQAISFPNFDFIEVASQAWEDSAFYEKVNQKFFFVIFQHDVEGVLRFKKCMFWNMPYEDRLEAEKVWKKAVEAIQSGDMTKLPKIKDSSVAHVRPHGRNKADTLPLPTGGNFTKQCFWLNQKYIKEQINR